MAAPNLPDFSSARFDVGGLEICNVSGVTIFSGDTVKISGDVNLDLGTLTTNGGSYVISQNSSFQVRATSDSDELTFTEDNKASNSHESLLRAAPSQYASLGNYDESGRAWDQLG